MSEIVRVIIVGNIYLLTYLCHNLLILYRETYLQNYVCNNLISETSLICPQNYFIMVIQM